MTSSAMIDIRGCMQYNVPQAAHASTPLLQFTEVSITNLLSPILITKGDRHSLLRKPKAQRTTYARAIVAAAATIERNTRSPSRSSNRSRWDHSPQDLPQPPHHSPPDDPSCKVNYYHHQIRIHSYTYFFFAKDVAAPVDVVAEQAATSCPSRRVSVMMGLGKIGQTMRQTMMMLKLRWRCRRQPQLQCANHAPLLCIFQLTTDGIPLPQIFPPSRLIYCSSSMYWFSHLSLLWPLTLHVYD